MQQAMQRVISLDVLKGLVMILMALDHTRDYFHMDAMYFDPVDPERSNYFIFLTRWITHYCAPAFCLLAGTSIFLVGRRMNKKDLSVFLLKRGVWLMLVEIFIVDFAWMFDIGFSSILLGVIWVLGLSMVCMSVLIHLPKAFLYAISALIIFGHNLLDGVESTSFLWSVLHVFNMFPKFVGSDVWVIYPLLPWLGVMSLGYLLGDLYAPDFEPKRRRKILLYAGLTCVALFALVRGLNGYGNTIPWDEAYSGEQLVISFMAPLKYPPSLAYLMMTLGPIFIFLSLVEGFKGRVAQIITVFGKVPFFYYVLHLYLIHLLAMGYAELTGYGWEIMILKDWVNEIPALKGYGMSLGGVYLVTALVVVALYPLCKRYAEYKKNNREKWWLRYL